MSTPQFLTMEELTKLARREVTDSVSEQSRQSLPIPLLSGAGSIEIAYLFCPSLVRPLEGARMTPPEFMARLDPVTGRLLGLKAVTPADFQRNDQPDTLLGIFRLPEGVTADDYITHRGRLFVLYDALLRDFSNEKQPRAELAREFLSLFAELREAPIDAYYEVAGRQFFSRVRDAAQLR